MIIYSKMKAGRGTSSKLLTYIKIFDLESQEINYEQVLYDKALIARLTSGMYAFAGGHYYYNNNVIKLRYDLILGNSDI
jgi:hypothetical protein